MKEFLIVILSYIVAVLRLSILTLITFISGIHQIFFNRLEVSNVGLFYCPLLKDRNKMSYIDRLNMSNVDLLRPYSPADDIEALDDTDDDGGTGLEQ